MRRSLLLGVALGTLFAPASAQGLDREAAPKRADRVPVYPLRKSANGRYLVDQKGVPFLIAGDSPQALMVNFSEAEAER
jgi:hypothetical protein